MASQLRKWSDCMAGNPLRVGEKVTIFSYAGDDTRRDGEVVQVRYLFGDVTEPLINFTIHKLDGSHRCYEFHKVDCLLVHGRPC